MKNKEKEIEKIAWQIFQDRLQLQFKKELTAEEKEKLTNNPAYNRYREEAKKIYEKRINKVIKALNNKKYPVINIPADGKSGMIGGAYTLCFVYTKYKGNFVLKGYMREVEKYLKKNYTHYFCNFSLWHHGDNRDIWKFWKDGISISQPDHHRGSKYVKPQYKFWVGKFGDLYLTDEENEEIRKNRLYFKRMPKRWIPEFDLL